MGKNRNNYNKMYDSTNFEIPEEVLMETVEETEVDLRDDEAVDVEEVVEAAASEEMDIENTIAPLARGKVVECSKLNIRSKPSKEGSRVVTVVKAGTRLTIYDPESDKHGDWYEVCTADGTVGFCMKDYIELI